MKLSFYAHNDIEDAAKWYKIPIAFYDKNDVYIIQEDRCVFVGNQQQAVQFMQRNDGKHCESLFPRLESKRETEANAKLIAAAPELLEACNLALNALNAGMSAKDEVELRQVLRNVIKKATT